MRSDFFIRLIFVCSFVRSISTLDVNLRTSNYTFLFTLARSLSCLSNFIFIFRLKAIRLRYCCRWFYAVTAYRLTLITHAASLPRLWRASQATLAAKRNGAAPFTVFFTPVALTMRNFYLQIIIFL